MKRHDFVDRMLYLIREKLENNLPEETTLEEMIEIAKELINKIY
jgi:hypothetical protein